MGLQEAQSILRSFDRQRWIVHDKVSFDRRLERLAPAGEHPRMQIAARETDLDAVVVAQVIRRFRLAMPIEIGGGVAEHHPTGSACPGRSRWAGDPTTTTRCGPLTRTAIMSRSRRSPVRSPASKRLATISVNASSPRGYRRVLGVRFRKRVKIGAMTVWAPGAPTVIRNRPLGLSRNSEIDSNASS